MKGQRSVMIFALGGILGAVASAVAASSRDNGGLFGPEAADQQECEGVVSVMLQRKKEALDRRGRTIKARESDILAAEERMRQQFEELRSLRNEIRERMKDMDEEQQVEVDRLAEMFKKMRGKQSAKILEVTQPEIAVEVLRRMGPGKSGAALAAMAPEKASVYASLITAKPPKKE